MVFFFSDKSDIISPPDSMTISMIHIIHIVSVAHGGLTRNMALVIITVGIGLLKNHVTEYFGT